MQSYYLPSTNSNAESSPLTSLSIGPFLLLKLGLEFMPDPTFPLVGVGWDSGGSADDEGTI